MDGQIVHSHTEIEQEVVEFYTYLVGTASQVTQGVDISALRQGKVLSLDKARHLELMVIVLYFIKLVGLL